MVHIFNSLSGAKEELRPITPGRISLYVCGITAYDYCHMGHARVMVVFDVVVRHLRHCGYAVHYVRNITDIDDKIIARARSLGLDEGALTERFIAAMHEDQAALGVLPPDDEPRATAHMQHIIEMIQQLMTSGHAYQAGGDVYYDVSHFPRYGALSHMRLDELRAGSRIEPGEHKQDPLDFALWKAAKAEEPAWDSPWGPGRPGWHIECSAMSLHTLGKELDIHGGGMDLKFPHHENEIAQSEACTGVPFVRLWMHLGFVQVREAKMAKSLGNAVLIRDLVARFGGEALRLFLLGTHYRSPLMLTDEALEAARRSLWRLYGTLAGHEPAEPDWPEGLEARFAAAMDDDLNTALALAVLFELAREASRLRRSEPKRSARYAAGLRKLGGLLGLLGEDPEVVRRGAVDERRSAAIEAMIVERAQARGSKEYAKADAIREKLAQEGVVLEDGPAGTTWRLAGEEGVG